MNYELKAIVIEGCERPENTKALLLVLASGRIRINCELLILSFVKVEVTDIENKDCLLN